MEGSINELIQYRFSKAKEDVESAERELEAGGYRLSLNRSYYAIFHCMRAVNAIDLYDSSKHSGVISHFNQYYVKTGAFPKEISKIIRTSSEMREQADYEDFFTASRADAEEQLEKAKQFIEYTERFLKEKGLLN